jgi:hypothetical protein
LFAELAVGDPQCFRRGRGSFVVPQGIGILKDERYIGRITWGRSRWKRGAADSSKRVNLLVEDRSQWVTHEDRDYALSRMTSGAESGSAKR